jgi:quinolinate synthase
MKLITLEKVYNTLKFEIPEIKVEPKIQMLALKPVLKMLQISNQLGL